VEKIGEELRKNGIKKVLMIYGGGSIKRMVSTKRLLGHYMIME